MLKAGMKAVGLGAGLVLAPGFVAAQEAEEPMRELVVTATLEERDSASVPAFTSVVTAEDIAKSPVNSLADLLRESVGINNQTDANGRDNVQIRGMGGRYTLVLINGKRVSSGGALWRGGDFDFSSIPLASIERVEIVRGPMAALYGSDAIGGVINIITKRPDGEWHGSISDEYRNIVSGSEGDQRRASISAAGGITDSVSQSLAVELYDRDPWYGNSGTATNVPRLEEKKSESVTGTTSVKLGDSQSIDVDLGYNHDERPYGIYSAPSSYRRQSIERYSYGLTHNGSWDWGKSVAFVKYEDGRIGDFNTRYPFPQQRLKEENTYAKGYVSTDLLPRNSLTAGVELRSQKLSDPVDLPASGGAKDGYENGSLSLDTYSAFAQDEISLTKKLALTLGGRYDETNKFSGRFSPKGYLTYTINRGVTVKGGVGGAYKVPDPNQFAANYGAPSCGGSCTISGNPNLKPETSLSYELGVEVRKRNWKLSADVFQNDVDDLIVASFVDGQRAWVNLNKAKTNGIEIDASYRIIKSLSLSGNFAYLDAKSEDATGVESNLEWRPRTKGHLSVDWQPTSALSTSLSANHVGRQYQLQYIAQLQQQVLLPISQYVRYDWTSSLNLGDNVVLRAGIKNITDVDLTKKADVGIVDVYTFELGRNYYLGVTFNF